MNPFGYPDLNRPVGRVLRLATITFVVLMTSGWFLIS
jgi:hypothetical protein